MLDLNDLPEKNLYVTGPYRPQAEFVPAFGSATSNQQTVSQFGHSEMVAAEFGVRARGVRSKATAPNLLAFPGARIVLGANLFLAN